MKHTLRIIFYILLLVFIAAGCSSDSDSGSNNNNGQQPGIVSGTVWNRYGSIYGYETDIAFGNIAGEPANRVYMCEKPGSPHAGLYKGHLNGNVITWDDEHDLPQTEIEVSGSQMNFYYLLANRELAGTYELGEWTNHCNIDFENGTLVNNTKSLTILMGSEYLANTITSIKVDNITIPETLITTVGNHEGWCAGSITLPQPSLPAGSDNPYYYMLSITYMGDFGGSQTIQTMLTEDGLERGCNVWKLSGIGFEYLRPVESSSNPQAPEITTTEISEVVVTPVYVEGQWINMTTLTIGATNIEDNGDAIYYRGVCYSDSPFPTIVEGNNGQAPNGGTANFLTQIENLNPGTTYYFRAYAQNNSGISYGETKTFTTAP